MSKPSTRSSQQGGRNREAKRHIVGLSKDTGMKMVADREHASALVADTQKELQKRLRDMKQVCEQVKLDQLNKYNAKMTKFSATHKKMTLNEMKALYGFDLLDKVTNGKSGATSSSKVLATPAPTRGGKGLTTPTTVRRRRETFFEDGNDEEALVVTVSKKRPNAANLGIHLGGGEFLSLNDPACIDEMDNNLKDVAKSNLLKLQDQLSTLLDQL